MSQISFRREWISKTFDWHCALLGWVTPMLLQKIACVNVDEQKSKIQ